MINIKIISELIDYFFENETLAVPITLPTEQVNRNLGHLDQACEAFPKMLEIGSPEVISPPTVSINKKSTDLCPTPVLFEFHIPISNPY